MGATRFREIRQTFESELAKRGLSSKMVEDANRDRNYEWEYSKKG